MKFNLTASRLFALAAVLLVAAVSTITSSHNQRVPEPSLGPGWQCSRTTLFATTTCSRSSVGQEHRSRRLLAAE